MGLVGTDRRPLDGTPLAIALEHLEQGRFDLAGLEENPRRLGVHAAGKSFRLSTSSGSNQPATYPDSASACFFADGHTEIHTR
jgi:hypothetical protein